MIKILKKPSHKRSENNLEILLAFMKNVKFFQERDIKTQDFLEIVSCLQHECFENDEYICHWGDSGDKFYICLKGAVRVLIPSLKIKNSKDEMQFIVDDIAKHNLLIEDIDKLISLKEAAF